MSAAIATREATITVASRTLAEIIADLSRPIAPEDLGHMKRGSADLSFIPWYRAIKYLDDYAPGWSYEVRAITPVPGSVALTVRITIPCAEGLVYREATGIEEEEVKGYGDPTSNAESMALRRAAAKFGLGLYLYDKGNGASRGVKSKPEPVRPVNLEGAQPMDKSKRTWPQNKKYAPIFGKCGALNFAPDDLANYIQMKFNLAVSDDPIDALDALTPLQLKELDQALAGEFNNRNRTK